MTIEEKYKLKKLANNKYPLEKWYNQLIEKETTAIDSNDICKMIRQSILLDLALPRALDMLSENPLIGNIFLGELLYSVYHYQKEIIINNKIEFGKIIENVKEILKYPDGYSDDIFIGISEKEVNDIRIVIEGISKLIQ